MKQQNASESNLLSLLAIVFLYIVIIILILAFSNQILIDLSFDAGLKNFIIVPIAVILPIFLFVSVIVNIIKLIKTRKSSGTKFKVKVLMFFVFISLLSSIPQGILSVNFIKTVFSSTFNSNLNTSMEDSIEISLDYYKTKKKNFEKIVKSEYVVNLLETLNFERTWQKINSISHLVNSLQIFNSNGDNIIFFGDEKVKLDKLDLNNLKTGLQSRESIENISFIKSICEFYSNKNKYYAISSTIFLPDFESKTDGLMQAYENFAQFRKFKKVFGLAIFILYSLFSLPLILVSISISFLLSNEFIRPIASLEEATKRIAEGDFSFRLLVKKGGELAVLVDSFNKMISELENYRLQTKQTEKISAWQEIAQRLAHEIKNPLTPIKLSAERVLKKYNDGEKDIGPVLNRSVSSIINEVNNLNKLLEEFRTFAKLPVLKLEKVNLKKVLNETISVYFDTYSDLEITCDNIEDNIEIFLDKAQINQVFNNLLKNSMEAMDFKGKIFIRVTLIKKGNISYCRISIRDNGKGISDEYQYQVFNPYFTTKKKGTGLGLPIVERIIFDHKGQIWFETQENIGTTFYIDLPLES